MTYVCVSTAIREALPWFFSLKFYVYVCPLYFYNDYNVCLCVYVPGYRVYAYNTIKNGVCLCNGMFLQSESGTYS